MGAREPSGIAAPQVGEAGPSANEGRSNIWRVSAGALASCRSIMNSPRGSIERIAASIFVDLIV